MCMLLMLMHAVHISIPYVCYAYDMHNAMIHERHSMDLKVHRYAYLLSLNIYIRV